MNRPLEAIVERDGAVRLLEPVRLPRPCRALVTILPAEPAPAAGETALLRERALAEDWNRPEEEAAWSYLQPGR